jgi:Zn-dependent protease with chaperone function
MQAIDFDLARYVAYRRGMVEQRARDGSAYSYAGERKVRRALSSARPVTLALEATTRLWKGSARDQLLGASLRATDQDYPEVYAAGLAAARILGMTPAPVFVAPATARLEAQALGTDDDAVVVLSRRLVDRLSQPELVAVIGHELGHVQNNHILYATALYYLRNDALFFVRWIVQPAIMTLQAWSRRAEITCDRAALLCARELDVALAAIVKLEMPDADADRVRATLDDMPEPRAGVMRYAEYFRSHPHLPKRVQALRVFADGRFFRRFSGDELADGLGAEELDDQVSQILSVF